MERAKAENAGAKKRPSRVRDVSARNFNTCRDPLVLVWTIFGAVRAHQGIYTADPERPELHGDINPSSLIELEHPDIPGEDSPWDTPYVAGALIYWEPPISIQTLREFGNLDKPMPPPSRRRR